VNSCRWVPGADAQGRPTAIWVILPLRFTQG
jgi:periplasmic protein TonB